MYTYRYFLGIYRYRLSQAIWHISRDISRYKDLRVVANIAIYRDIYSPHDTTRPRIFQVYTRSTLYTQPPLKVHEWSARQFELNLSPVSSASAPYVWDSISHRSMLGGRESDSEFAYSTRVYSYVVPVYSGDRGNDMYLRIYRNDRGKSRHVSSIYCDISISSGEANIAKYIAISIQTPMYGTITFF